VSELSWLIDDIRRAIEVLPDAEAPDDPNEEQDDRTWLLRRLDEVDDLLEQYLAHKLRTYYFSLYKRERLDAVQNDPTRAFDISDYWGKIGPKKSKEGVGEGTQSGISVHGSYFVVANPPAEIRDEWGATVDFSKWPPPPTDGNALVSDLVVLNYRVICDDARQTPFSVRAVKTLQYERLKKEMPWLQGVYGQSDQCDDYHSTQAVIAFSQIRATTGDADELRILEHGHTEAGEGKCVVDMNCGQSKQDLSRDRDQGHDHECADEIFSGLERRSNLCGNQLVSRIDGSPTDFLAGPRAGDVNVVMAIDRTKEQEKKAPPLPRAHNYAHCTFHVDGSITCRECFGLGRGLTYTEAQLAMHDQHKVEDAIATATMESDAVVPKTQLSHAQKSEERAAKRRKKSALLDRADARRAADEAAVALEQGEDATHECGACKRRFMTSGGLLKHAATCAGKRRSSRRGVLELMSDLAVEQDADLERERRELARVEVDLPVATSGLSFTEDVVSEVSGAAAASLKVGKGYVLRRVGSTDVGDDAGQAIATACAAARGDTITYVLERPAPPLPPHGWARKALRTTSRPRYTVEQKAFLDKHFESGLKGGERMRDKKVWKLMKAEFGRRVGENDKSLVLKQSQIRGYFSRRAAALKGSAVAKFLEDGDAAGDGGDGGDDYSKYKVSELREFLVRRGLDSDGLKQALVDRLREHDGTA